MTEADLALKYIDYLSEYEVYKEVPGGGGIIDLVTLIGSFRVVLEVKCALNFEVIWQAYQGRAVSHYAYAAVPVKHSIHPAQKALCQHFGIGILAYRELKTWGRSDVPKYRIEELLKPQLNRRPGKLRLEEYMKRSQAGSQNNRITAFGHFVECVEEVLGRGHSIRNGERVLRMVTPKDLFEAISYKHYNSFSVFKTCLVKYANNGVLKNVDWDGKHFSLKPKESIENGLKKAGIDQV